MPRGVKFNPPDLAALLSAYQSGQTALQIARWCGCSRDTVYRLLKAHGVEPREAGRPKKAVSIDEAARMYQDGWSVTELAQLFGCYRGTIDNRLFAAGVKARSTSPQRARAEVNSSSRARGPDTRASGFATGSPSRPAPSAACSRAVTAPQGRQD